MEKDIGKISKNDNTDVIIRMDDFGGNRGLTIREFVSSDRYTGFTKAGVRIRAPDFKKFKEMINSVSESEMNAPADAPSEEQSSKSAKKPFKPQSRNQEQLPDY